MIRLFVLREPAHFDSMVAALKANWKVMADAGQPLGCHVAPYKRTRRDEANSLMWVWLTQIARDAWVAGRQFVPETWHEHFKELFLPEANARGDEKWAINVDGTRRVVMSTTRLNTTEMSTYMTAFSAFAATDLGVTIQ